MPPRNGSAFTCLPNSVTGWGGGPWLGRLGFGADSNGYRSALVGSIVLPVVGRLRAFSWLTHVFHIRGRFSESTGLNEKKEPAMRSCELSCRQRNNYYESSKTTEALAMSREARVAGARHVMGAVWEVMSEKQPEIR